MLRAILTRTKPLLRPIQNPLKLYIRHYPYPVQFHNFLKNLPSAHYSKLENGLTVATEERECQNVTIGIYVDAGSRYESDFENGLTHFFEHIAFKGSHARQKCALEEQMSCTGALFRCFTTREMVGYYAQCLSQNVPIVFDILTDCIFNNSFAEAEIEHQRKVVYQEMEECDRGDSNILLDDYLHSTAYQGTPLGKTVMGLSTNLPNFDSATISRYIKKFFNANRTVVAAVGGLKHDQIVYLACTFMSKLEPTRCMEADVYRYTGSEVRFRNDSMPLANVAMAVEGPAMCDEDNVVMQVAASHIGGWDRTQPGGPDHPSYVARAASASPFCDSYKSLNITYKDTGLWGVQFIGSSLQLDDMVLTVQGEWMNLCNTVTDGELERAKRLLKTKMLSQYQSSVRTCHELGRHVLYMGHMPPLHERMAAVERVFAPQMRAACQRYVYDKCLAVAAVGPTEGLPDYTRIRNGMYWLRM